MAMKSYVEFFGDEGLILKHERVREVENRDCFVSNMPKGAYGYRFFDKPECIIDGKLEIGTPRNYSHPYYIGKVYAIKDIEEEFPEEKELINRIREKRLLAAVKTTHGKWVILEQGDMVINQ